MKITYCESPFFMEFRVMANLNKFFDEIKKLGFVYIHTSFHTKTRIDTSMYLSGFMFGINIKVEDIITHEEGNMNFLTGEHRTANFFRILKAQKIAKFEEYIFAIAGQYLPDEIELRIFETKVIGKLKDK